MDEGSEFYEGIMATIISSLEELISFCISEDLGQKFISMITEKAVALPFIDTVQGTDNTAILSIDHAITLADSIPNLLSVVCSDGSSFARQLHKADILDLVNDISIKLGYTLRNRQSYRVKGLYVIIDPEVTSGRNPLQIAQAAVRGGASMLQLRDKLRDKGESLKLAWDLQELCVANDVLLIINDHIDLAVAINSGGVHLGQTDLPVKDARAILKPGQVLGRSNREYDQLSESQDMNVDHVAFGPIYATTTKSTGREPQGSERLKQARALTTLPLVAIGGINVHNLAPVIVAGADAICVTASVGLSDDPERSSNELVEAISSAGGKI
ncbi:MAG: thiamine phosphate synthase [Chloroflexota bacterium]|nr:thiamine phosphate synthase [Chloroflexota bacterium]